MWPPNAQQSMSAIPAQEKVYHSNLLSPTHQTKVEIISLTVWLSVDHLIISEEDISTMSSRWFYLVN